MSSSSAIRNLAESLARVVESPEVQATRGRSPTRSSNNVIKSPLLDKEAEEAISRTKKRRNNSNRPDSLQGLRIEALAFSSRKTRAS